MKTHVPVLVDLKLEIVYLRFINVSFFHRNGGQITLLLYI